MSRSEEQTVAIIKAAEKGANWAYRKWPEWEEDLRGEALAAGARVASDYTSLPAERAGWIARLAGSRAARKYIYKQIRAREIVVRIALEVGAVSMNRLADFVLRDEFNRMAAEIGYPSHVIRKPYSRRGPNGRAARRRPWRSRDWRMR